MFAWGLSLRWFVGLSVALVSFVARFSQLQTSKSAEPLDPRETRRVKHQCHLTWSLPIFVLCTVVASGAEEPGRLLGAALLLLAGASTLRAVSSLYGVTGGKKVNESPLKEGPGQQLGNPKNYLRYAPPAITLLALVIGLLAIVRFRPDLGIAVAVVVSGLSMFMENSDPLREPEQCPPDLDTPPPPSHNRNAGRFARRDPHKEVFTLITTSTPLSEYSPEFLEGMLARMAVSFHKYGAVQDAFVAGVDFLDSAAQRISEYRKTKNTEFLIDAANFLMMEFMYPSISGAEFVPTDSEGSPGRKLTSGRNSFQRNRDLF
ncbi:MAG: hypothetical protein ACT4OM_06115 [Actinomycetota bacterium]